MVWSLSEHFDKSPYSLLGRETSQRKGRAKETFGTAGPVCGEDQKYPHVYWRDWSNKGEEKRRRWRAGKTRLDVHSAFGLSEMKSIVSWLFLVPESWLPLPAQDCSVQCGQWPCLLGACGAVGECRSWHTRALQFCCRPHQARWFCFHDGLPYTSLTSHGVKTSIR